MGARGKSISRVMENFKVNVRFPHRDSPDPDLVVVSGREENVSDCCDHLFNLANDYVSVFVM